MVVGAAGCVSSSSLILFKVIGAVVHRKVDVYYKYKAGDLRMGLWNRLNHRLGLCLGLANAAVYLVLISLVIYVLSYVDHADGHRR